MDHVSDDTQIVQFYDELFEVASSIVKKGEEHAPMVLILNTAGALRGLLLVGLDPDQRASLFFSMAARPDVRAAALVVESWYVEGDLTDAAHGAVLDLAIQGPLENHPERKEAIVISIMTATRQAVMLCPIDRSSNSLLKQPFHWLSEQSQLTAGRCIRSASETAQ
jgi:hypothetical protein